MPAQPRIPCEACNARRSRRLALLFLGAALGVALACGNEPASDASSARVGDVPAGASTAPLRSEAAGQSPTEAAIEREFRKICSAFKKGDDQYYGERKAEELTRWLKEARSRQLGAKEQTLFAVARDAHANELLQIGRTEEAIRSLEAGDVRAGKATPLAGAQTGDPTDATAKSEAGE